MSLPTNAPEAFLEHDEDLTDNHAKPPHSPSPGSLTIIRRNGTPLPFDPSRIALAITKAFWDVEGDESTHSTRVSEIVHKLTEEIAATLVRRIPINGGTVHVEDIQDQVELALMRHEFQQVARSYILYREERRKVRELALSKTSPGTKTAIQISLNDGTKAFLDSEKLYHRVEEACVGLKEVKSDFIVEDTLRNIFEGIPLEQVHQALIMSTRTLIEEEPNYSYVAARLLLKDLQEEACDLLNVPVPKNTAQMAKQYGKTLGLTLRKGCRSNA